MAGPFTRLRALFARQPRGEQTRRISQPVGARHPYAGQRVLPGISPKRLAQVLRDADLGNYDDFLLAAQELEERDAQYGAQMLVRRAAVSALELVVERPPGVGSRAGKAAQELVDSQRLKEAIHYSLDAIGKGYSITEIVWEAKGRMWWPNFVRHEPWEFEYKAIDDISILGAKTWRLRDGTYRGADLAPSKWVIHEPLGRSGDPIRRGTARPAMYLHMAKSMSIAGWVQLMAVFGLPLAIATAPQHLNDNDRRVLSAALAGLGQGINAIVPAGTTMEIVKAADAGATPDRMFATLLEYVDAQISKLVIGQTMTADNGSSQAQARVHNEVRKDIREGDAEQLANTLNRYVVQPFIDFNVGPQRVYPKVVFNLEEERDLKVWTEAVTAMIDRGLPVSADEVYPVYGLTRPEGVPAGLILKAPRAPVGGDEPDDRQPPEAGEVGEPEPDADA